MTMDERQSSANMALLQAKYTPEKQGRITRFAISRFYATLGRLLAQVDAQSVLDAGSGEGHIMERFLLDRFSAVYGLDLDRGRLAYGLARRPDARVAQANLQQLPLPSKAVDLVIALEVLEHVGDPARALDELWRVTRRWAILSVPNEPLWRIGNMVRGAYWRQWGNTPEHINHWSRWGFARFVSARFAVIEVANPFTWTFILAEKR
jgi:ubiquinone/menaquinone biosynthesis C-methylase UbiE